MGWYMSLKPVLVGSVFSLFLFSSLAFSNEPIDAVRDFLTPLSKKGKAGISDAVDNSRNTRLSDSSSKKEELAKLMSSGGKIKSAEEVESDDRLGGRLKNSKYKVTFTNGDVKVIKVKLFKDSEGNYNVMDFVNEQSYEVK